MTRKYTLVVESSSTRYSAYVPELPTVVVAAATMEELTKLAQEAIQIYLEEVGGEPATGAFVHEVEVELAG